MLNCIDSIALKRSRINYLSECSFVRLPWRAISFSCGEGLSFHFIEFYFVATYDVTYGCDFYEMLVLGFVEMPPVMLDLFLTSVSVVEVCFLCLEVTCYKWLIIEVMMLFYF